VAARRDTAFIEWLGRHGPDEWHRAAQSWNWDGSHDVLMWIVTRPDCDTATALDVFWKSAPEIALDESAATIPGWSADNKLATTILENWKRGFYRHSRFAYRFEADWFHVAVEEKYQRLRKIIPADMAVDRQGEPLDTSDYMEGFSPQAVAHLASLGISL
jgi:hypothetical protein